MSLLHSAEEVMNYVRNLPRAVVLIYEDLTALDTRVSNVETGNEIVIVAVSVASGATSGASSANANIKSGKIIGIVPTGNVDSVSAVALSSSNGAVTVTLKAAATAIDTFNVAVLI